MALGQFVAPASGGKAGSFDPRENSGKPIIVVPREFKTGFTSTAYPTPKDVVRYDVVDLLSGDIHVNVFSGAGAIVDRLHRYIPGGELNPSNEAMPLPVKITAQISASTQRKYYSIEGLEGQELELAQLWDQKVGIAAVHAKSAEAAAAAQQEAATAAPGNGLPAWAQGGGAAATTPAADAATGNALSGTSDADLAKAIAALK